MRELPKEELPAAEGYSDAVYRALAEGGVGVRTYLAQVERQVLAFERVEDFEEFYGPLRIGLRNLLMLDLTFTALTAEDGDERRLSPNDKEPDEIWGGFLEALASRGLPEEVVERVSLALGEGHAAVRACSNLPGGVLGVPVVLANVLEFNFFLSTIATWYRIGSAYGPVFEACTFRLLDAAGRAYGHTSAAVAALEGDTSAVGRG